MDEVVLAVLIFLGIIMFPPVDFISDEALLALIIILMLLAVSIVAIVVILKKKEQRDYQK